LSAYDWRKFAESKVRQQRYQQLATIASNWGVAFGADQPIAEQQQHGWYMINPFSPMGEQLKQIAEACITLAPFFFFSQTGI